MRVTVRHFAAAAEAAGASSEAADAATAEELRTVLVTRHGAAMAAVLAHCSLLSDGRRLEPADALVPGATVDVLPPFAGG